MLFKQLRNLSDERLISHCESYAFRSGERQPGLVFSFPPTRSPFSGIFVYKMA